MMNNKMTKGALLAMTNINRSLSVSKRLSLSVPIYFLVSIPLNSCDFFRKCDWMYLLCITGKAV